MQSPSVIGNASLPTSSIVSSLLPLSPPSNPDTSFQISEISDVDRFYCSTCQTGSRLRTSYKVVQRKSSRDVRQLDYSNFAAHLGSEPDKWMRVLATRATTEGAFKTIKAEEITEAWLYHNEEAMTEPFVVEYPEGLGMEMPSSDMTISEIARIVGTLTLNPTHLFTVANH